MAKNIVQLNIDGTSYTQRPYGTCSTAANIAVKVVACDDFNLVEGSTVMVKFTNANTVDNPTLNVNNTGDKTIHYRGTALTASSLANWNAGDVVEFRYNGTQWDLLNVGNTIPTIGNGTITIKQNDAVKGTFTVNQTGNATIELTDTTTGEANVQSDWDETNTTSDAYIKNKPTIPAAVIVDTSLSSTSTNPVQNNVINSALNNKMDKVTLATVATSGSYNDLTNKPTIPTIPSSLPSNGIINAYTTNGITSPAISISSAIRFDTMVCAQYLNNTNNKFTGCNNAILSISRFNDDQYTTQLGFSGNGIYARIFSAKTPDTTTSWRTMIMDDGAGNVTANAFYISSDERLKTFGDDIKVDFDELAKLRKSYFVFNDNPTKQEIGVSAQEVQKIYPEIVNETEEGTLSVDYSKLAVVALAAIDKLNQRVQELENKLAKYE